MAVSIKSEREIELMRESCKILAEVHAKLGEAIKPGISTGFFMTCILFCKIL